MTTGELEASTKCTPHSEFAFELVVQLRLPTTSSAVVSPTSSRALAWSGVVKPLEASAYDGATSILDVGFSHGVTPRA